VAETASGCWASRPARTPRPALPLALTALAVVACLRPFDPVAKDVQSVIDRTRADLARVPRAAAEAGGVALLRRFAAYLEKRFDLRALVAGLHDARRRPRIPTRAVWLAAFGMYLLRLRSFNTLEQELHLPNRWEAWVGGCKPSADTIGRVLAKMSTDETRQVLCLVLHDAGRSKAIHSRPGELYMPPAPRGDRISNGPSRLPRVSIIAERGNEVRPFHRAGGSRGGRAR
jgi:hypothetical protein